MTAEYGVIYDEVVPEIKLKNAYMTPIGRRTEDYHDLLDDAVKPLLSASDPERITRIYFSSFAPVELCGINDPATSIERFFRDRHPSVNAPVHGPFKTGGEALFRALSDPGDGDVLVAGCEKMTHVSAAHASGLLAPRVSGAVERRHGATLPALGALVTQSYARAFGVPLGAFDRVAHKNHTHAVHNPRAHFQRPVTLEEIQHSPLVADPLRRHHCAPMSDGAAACVLSRDDGPVALRGWARSMDAVHFHDRIDHGRFPAAARAGAEALSMAKRSNDDIDVVEIHDAFSPFELITLEELGFFAPGRAWRALKEGKLHVGGSLAVNPSGGMKARGHPIGVCGLTSLVEMYAQLTGDAGKRQQHGAQWGLVQSAGGVAPDTYVFVLEALT